MMCFNFTPPCRAGEGLPAGNWARCGANRGIGDEGGLGHRGPVNLGPTSKGTTGIETGFFCSGMVRWGVKRGATLSLGAGRRAKRA